MVLICDPCPKIFGCEEKRKITVGLVEGILISVRLWNFKDGGSLKAKFLVKNQYTQRNSFKNSFHDYCTSKSAKIVLSKSIFDVKNQLNLLKKKLRLRPNILSKRLGGRSLSRLMKNFGLGLLTD